MVALRWGAPRWKLRLSGQLPKWLPRGFLSPYSWEQSRVGWRAGKSAWPLMTLREHLHGVHVQLSLFVASPLGQEGAGIPPHPCPHFPPSGPSFTPRSHEALLALDTFRDLALLAADSFLLVMPAWEASLTGHLESQGLAFFLSRPFCKPGAALSVEWLGIPAWPHPPPLLSQSWQHRLCLQFARSLC